MVNVHGKYPEGAVNKTAYSTDGSNVRDATEEEKVRYRDANKHQRKKPVDGKSSSSEPSQSGTALTLLDTAKARPASAREARGDGDVSSGDRGGANRTEERGRENCSTGGGRGDAKKRDDRESSRNRSDRRTRTAEKEAASGNKLDEEENNRHEMAEILARLEARKASKDLEIARATIADLKAAKKNAAATTALAAVKKASGVDPRVVNSRAAKKSATSQRVSEPDVSASVMPTAEGPFEPVIEPSVPVVTDRGRANRCASSDRRENDALATLKFAAMTATDTRLPNTGEDASNTTLGIALVASALGRKVPRGSTEMTTADMAECYVGLGSTRNKTKAPGVVAPPNSVESDDLDRGDNGSEVGLSQSDVHIGFPGDSGEPIPNAQPASPSREPALGGDDLQSAGTTDVAANEEVRDAPSIPKETTMPVPVLGEPGGGSGREAEVDRTDSPRIVAPGSAEEKAMWKTKRENKLRMIKEIAASQLLQEELAKTDPNLVSVASFLSKVCGTNKDTRHLKETAGSLIREGGKEGVVAETAKGSADRGKEEIAGTGAVAILSSGLSGGYEGPATAFEPSDDSGVIPGEE